MPLTKIQSLGITDGTIVNADINASAAIAGTKLTGVGKVLQVVTATDATQRSTTSASYVTGSNTLSISITPSSTSNKIFIIATTTTINQGGAQSYFTIYRDSTNLAGAAGFHYTEGNAGEGQELPTTMSYLDSPSTTSATTYQVYMKSSGSGVYSYLNAASVTGTITAFEIGA